MTKLPPLPVAASFDDEYGSFTDDQMQAYGQQCRDAAIEDCAELAEMHDACAPAYIAESIRSLKNDS